MQDWERRRDGTEVHAPQRRSRRESIAPPPVLFARRFVPELMGLDGDEGARSLIDRHPEEVAEIEAGSTTIFADFDTPESLAALRGE